MCAERTLLTIADGRAVVLGAVGGPLPAEPVPVRGALGRALAEDVAAEGPVPPFDSSAMDGYALRAGPPGRALRVVGEARAGAPARVAVEEGTAIRISTGAAVPDGATSVVPIERIAERDGDVEHEGEAGAGDNIRRAGEDLAPGEVVLTAGTPLGPVELGLAVIAGRAEVRCARRPRVAVMATGDELVAPGRPLGPGQIHDSNAPTLAALAERAGAEVVARREEVPDRRAATAAALDDALSAADVVLVSGGVSVGPHDHVRPALEELGVEQRFWGVDLQPGKPTWFGARDDTLVFGLPGNPVSAVVTFHLFARPALRALQGLTPLPAREPARLGAPVGRKRREQAVRVALATEADGLVATDTGPQESHRLTSMRGADALAFVPSGEGELARGERVEVERL